MDRAEALGDARLEVGAAGPGRDAAREKHRLVVIGEHLVGELAFLAMLDENTERGLFLEA